MIILKYFYLINNKKLSCLDLSKFIIKKIENSFNKNYLININYELIIKQSNYCDYLISVKKNKITTGIPTIFKDIYSDKNNNTSGGSRILKNYNSFYNSTIINKLNNLNFINFGKTNLDEFAVGSNNFNYYYGKPINSTNKYLNCGGSSGGGPYLVSKKIIPVSLNSDTGGSTRQPAYLNSLIGLKTTYGSISRNGILSYSSSLDNVGIISSNVLDLAITLNVLSGFDLKDFTTFNKFKEDYTRYINKNWLVNSNLKNKPFYGLSIGISKHFFETLNNFDVRSGLEKILNIFEFLGAKINFIHLYFFEFIHSIYYIISSSELYSNLSRYDNFIYNNNFFNFKNFNKLFFFNNTLKEKLINSNYILNNENNNKKFLFSKKFRRLILENFKKSFSICDIIILPISPNLAFKNNFENYSNTYLEFYNSIINIAGLPSISLNTNFKICKKLKFPLSFQIVGNYFKEARIIQIANIFLNFKCI